LSKQFHGAAQSSLLWQLLPKPTCGFAGVASPLLELLHPPPSATTTSVTEVKPSPSLRARDIIRHLPPRSPGAAIHFAHPPSRSRRHGASDCSERVRGTGRRLTRA